MSGGATGQPQKMRDFVSRVFQGSPDLSILTHDIIRKKYLDYVGLENLSKQEKKQLKQLVEEELVQMKVDQPPSNVDLRTEAQDSFKSGDCKRPLHISHSLEEEIKNEQEHKRQKIEKKLEISSDKKDSGIDSKKCPWHRSPKLLRNFSDSSDQGDSGAEDHSAQSESDEEITKSKRKPSLQEARGERGRGSKSAKGQGNRGSQKRVVSDSEEAPDMGQSDLEEEIKTPRKVTKGNSLKQRDLKKKVDKESKATDPKDKAKNRAMNKQKEEKDQSEGGTDLSEDKHSGKNEEHPSIQRLKRYIWKCGAWRNYKKLLAGCRSRKAQIEVLKEELEGLGIKGIPSLAKCKAIKQKREEAAEVASLDVNNIIATEGRPKRRNVCSLYNKPQDSPSSPEEPTVRRHTTDWSQLQGVISSGEESS